MAEQAADPRQQLNDLMAMLGKAPESQADPLLVAELNQMIAQGYTAAHIKQLLDGVVYGGLASDFFVIALSEAHKMAVNLEAKY